MSRIPPLAVLLLLCGLLPGGPAAAHGQGPAPRAPAARATRAGAPAATRAAAPTPAPPRPAGTDTALVVLVHGMGRTSLSMLPLEWKLERAGYRVLNFGYNSYGPGVAEIGGKLGEAIAAELEARPARPVHFVGHSLGNIVVRWLLAHEPPDAEVGRFVMLAPPNRGARAADRLTPWVGWLLAPIRELRTNASTVTALAPPAGVEFAIIAGSRDRKVRIDEAFLPGATAFAIVPSGHTFIAMRPRVQRMILGFLATGSLPPPESRSADGANATP